MALVEVNTNNAWLSSATKANFQDSSDVDRYKTFTNALANGESTVFNTDLLNTMMSKMSNFFSQFSSANKGSLVDMILDAIEDVLGLGYSILSKLGITGIVNSICGGFDANTFGRYGDMSGLYSLGLMGMLTALLCMAVKGALGIVAAGIGAIGMGVGALVGVVNTTLDGLGFNPIRPITNALANGNFSFTNRLVSETKIDISDLVNDITSNSDLLNVFKNTSTAERLMTGYTGKGYEYEEKLNLLLPDYKLSSLSSTANARINLLNNAISTKVDAIDSSINSIVKKDYLMLM